MGLGFGSQIIKVILFIFNFIWLMFGIVLVIVGALICSGNKLFIDKLKDIDLPELAIFLIVVGTITILISFCGCCGACQESQCLTVTYSFVLFLIIIVEITVAILIFVQLKEQTVAELIHKHVENIILDKSSNADEVQSFLQCCGTTGPEFWEDKSKPLPGSCCLKENEFNCNTQNAFQEGCSQKMIDFIVKNKNALGYSTLGFAIVEFIAFVFSCVLAKNMD